MVKIIYLALVLSILSSCGKTPPTLTVAPTQTSVTASTGMTTTVAPTQTSVTASTGMTMPKVSNTEPTDKKKIVGANEAYTLSIPKSFTLDTDKSSVLDLSYVDDTAKIEVFTIIEPKLDVQVSSMEEYVDIAMESFKGLTKNALIDTIKNPKGYTVLDKRFTGNFQDQDVVMYTRLIDTGTDYIQIITVTDTTMFDKNVGIMLDIMSSFTMK